MNLKILLAILIYWSLVLVLFGGVLADDILFTDYNTSVNINDSFNPDEIDLEEAGFFDTIGVIFGAVGRFIGLILFGLTPALTGTLQILFSVWSTIVTVFAIGFVIDSLWSG